MNILITGNLGYVGAAVTRHLRQQHPRARLIGIDAGFFAHCVTGASRAPEVQLDVQYFGDVRRLPEGLFDGVDAVVHLAAVSNDPIGNAYEDVTFDINHQASLALAARAKAQGVGSFVFASSCSVYGSADNGSCSEQSPTRPLTAYARSKLLTEEGLAGLAGPGFVVTCLRFATACGMSERLRLDLVLNDFVAAAMTSGCITVLSDGSPWRPLIHVSDMARAFEWAVHRDPADAGPFLVVNAGSDRWNYQIRDLATAVAEVVAGTTVSVNAAAPPDRRSYRVDFSRFAELAPRHQPQEDLLSTVAGLRAGIERMGLIERDFRNSQLIRLKVLAELERQNLLTKTLEWADDARGLRTEAPGAELQALRAV